MTLYLALISFVVGQIFIVLIYFAVFNSADMQAFSDAEIDEKKQKVKKLFRTSSIMMAVCLGIAVLVT